MLKVGEATGMTLATIHNLRYYQRLIEELNLES
jgi:queuine/archaeosine tRNA-ribosyltransferase